MPRKVSKAKRKQHRRAPPFGTPEYEKWRANIADGMRRARLRRREAGLMNLAEVEAELALPRTAFRKMGFKIIQAGARYYIMRTEVERKKKELGYAA